jgi:hypothetical protein
MMNTVLVAPLLALASVGCIHTRSTPQSEVVAPSVGHSQIVFIVASVQGSHMLRGVRVSMIGRDGSEVELGQTDMFGSLTVPKSLLSQHQARIVLFSHEGFFTGAILVEAPGPNFYAFDERYIQLASFAVL